jgi:hypothetical protein
MRWLLASGVLVLAIIGPACTTDVLAKTIGPPVALKKRLPTQALPTPPKFELLDVFEIPGTEVFGDSRVGGLSGLVWDASQKMFWAVSDDRGRVNEPRVYGLSLNIRPAGKDQKLPKLEWKLLKKVLLKDPKADPKKKKAVWDFEGIALLPWGNWLIVSEGDMNQKPRVNSRVVEFKLSGDWVRDYDVPADYLAPLTGQQKIGPRNNFSFEGLSGSSVGDQWVVASELGLVQDKSEITRFLEYKQTEAWVLKPAREWIYSLAPVVEAKAPVAKVDTGTKLVNGVSEILHAQGNDWWVLERAAAVSVSGLSFQAELFQVTLASSEELTKELVLRLPTTDSRLMRNFEALAWGPDLPDGRKLLVILSDNNLEKGEPTVFASFAVTLALKDVSQEGE